MSRRSHLHVSDGTRLAYRLTGPPDAPLAILLDGISCDGYVFKRILPALEETMQVLHVHHRGHGRSGLPRDVERVTMPHLARDLDEVMQALDLDAGVLIAHSMGVQVALELALRHPSRVRGAVLMNGSYGRLLHTFKGSDAAARALPALSALTRRFRGGLSASLRALLPTSISYTLATLGEIKGHLIRRRDFMPYLEHFSRMPLDVFTRMLVDASRRTTLASLPRITQPVLVLASADDSFTPLALSETMANHLANADLHVFSGTSHVGPMERPADYMAAIGAFLARQGLTRAATPAPSAPTRDFTASWRRRADVALTG